MQYFNYNFFSIDLDRLWSSKVSDNEDLCFIGYGRDEGKLLQFNINNKEITSYNTEGKYTLSISILSNTKAIVGTNNGYVIIIDVVTKERIKGKKVSGKSIKDIKLSLDEQIIYATCSNELLSIDINTLNVINKRELNFNPWDLIVIPNSKLIAISGSENKIELVDNKTLELLNSVRCGENNKDVSSLLYNKKNSLLISGNENGFLSFFNISSNGFNKEKELNIKDNIYWLQQTDSHIAFSTSKRGIILYCMKNKELLSAPDSLGESRFSLKEINNNTYLLYQKNNNNICLINVTKKNIEPFQLTDLPGNIKFINLNSNGNIIAVTSEGIALSNFIKYDPKYQTEYYFNSREHNIAVDGFYFNQINESLVIKCKDNSIKTISLIDMKMMDVDFDCEYKDYVSIRHFYDNFILFSNSRDVYLVNIKTNSTKYIVNNDEFFTSIKIIKIISLDHYVVLNSPDYRATPIIWDYIKKYNFEGIEVDRKKLDTIYGSMFIKNNKLVTTSINKPSKIIDLKTNKEIKFDIAYNFDENTDVFDDERYCIRIAIGDFFNYYMSCYDLTIEDGNGNSKKIWEIEDPKLETFSTLGYCQLDGYFYIVSFHSGDMMSIDKNNGDIINIYNLQKNIDYISISYSGKYIGWTLKTGEFSCIQHPFKSCKVTDE